MVGQRLNVHFSGPSWSERTSCRAESQTHPLHRHAQGWRCGSSQRSWQRSSGTAICHCNSHHQVALMRVYSFLLLGYIHYIFRVRQHYNIWNEKMQTGPSNSDIKKVSTQEAKHQWFYGFVLNKPQGDMEVGIGSQTLH